MVIESEILFLIGECSLRFEGDLEQTILLDFDLTKSGLKKIRNLKVPRKWKRRLQKCVINKVEQMRSNGYKIVSRHTFKIGNIYSASDTFDLNVRM